MLPSFTDYYAPIWLIRQLDSTSSLLQQQLLPRVWWLQRLVQKPKLKIPRLARIGGDEFVVLLPGVGTEETAVMLAEKIRIALILPIDLGGSIMNTSASIGVALYPTHGLNYADLMNSADVAMYEAKSAGRNAIKVYGSELVATVFRDIT